jgi:hypothetical protein
LAFETQTVNSAVVALGGAFRIAMGIKRTWMSKRTTRLDVAVVFLKAKKIGDASF